MRRRFTIFRHKALLAQEFIAPQARLPQHPAVTSGNWRLDQSVPASRRKRADLTGTTRGVFLENVPSSSSDTKPTPA